MPSTDNPHEQVDQRTERDHQTVWVRKGPSSVYHTEQRLPVGEFHTMPRYAAEALNLKPCTRCEHG